MRIGIDIDDTITNTIQMVRKYIHLYGHLYPNREELIKCEEELLRGTLKNKEINNFIAGYSKEVSKNLIIKKNARNVINKLHEEGNQIILITARSDNYYDDAYAYCYEFLKRKNIYFDKLITNMAYKDKMCKKENIDIMIDDAVDTVEAVRKLGIKSVLFNSLNNKNKKTCVDRVNSWLELYDYIHNLKNIKKED